MHVCQGRAAAHERLAVERFADETRINFCAPTSADRSIRCATARCRTRSTIGDLRTMLATAEAMAPRTVAIDDAVRDTGHRQTVIVRAMAGGTGEG